MDTSVAIFIFVVMPIVNLISCLLAFKVYSSKKKKKIYTAPEMGYNDKKIKENICKNL